MIDVYRMSGTGEGKDAIPPRSFGFCRWCGAERVRLQYLLCPDCFRIADMIPSKTSVVMNRPEVKKRLRGMATVKKLTPELRIFLTDPKTRFPADRNHIEHWEKMIEQSRTLVSDSDIRRYIDNLCANVDEDEEVNVPPDEEVEEIVSLENILRFFLHVAVLRGALKLDEDPDDASCMVCGHQTAVGSRSLCSSCRNELVHDVSDSGPAEAAPAKIQLGMHSRDIIMGKRGR